MKPIETRAYGYRFRSRLEARWAVFFHTLGLNWEYEPEGFDLGDELYLPDFRVTTGSLVYWYEIKPFHGSHSVKFDRFTELLDNESFSNVESRLLCGDPSDVFLGTDICPRCGRREDAEVFNDSQIGFSCWPCDMRTPSGGDNPKEIGFCGAYFWPCKGWVMINDMDYSRMLSRLEKACIAARSARFEHGEQL